MNSCFSLAVQLQSVRSIKARMKVALCSATKGGGILWLRFLRPGVLDNHHSTFVGHLLEKLHEQRYKSHEFATSKISDRDCYLSMEVMHGSSEK